MPDQEPEKPPLMDELREAVAAIIGSEAGAVSDEANLVQLGVDSLGMLQLVNRIRRSGLRVSFKVLAADPSLGAWHRYLDEMRMPPPVEPAEGPR